MTGKIDKARMKDYIVIGDSLYKDGDLLNSIKSYKRAGEKADRKDKVNILFTIAYIYDELNMPYYSLNTYKEIIQLDKNQAGAYYGMAIMYEALGKEDKALKNYFLATKIDPSYDRAYFYIADIYDRQGETDKAISYYEKVIEINPDDHMVYNNLGAIYEELGNYREAYRLLKKSLVLDPNYFRALFNMGVIYGRLGKVDKSMEYYYKALGENKYFPYIYLNISALYIGKKQYKESIEILTMGIKYNEEDYLYYNRACCYSLLGHKELAIEDLKNAIKLNPNNIQYIKEDSDFKNLKSMEEYQNIINKKG